MPQPTPDWDLVELRGKFTGTNGRPIAGRIRFRPRATRLKDLDQLYDIVSREVAVTLVPVITDEATGAGYSTFTVQLPATDDPDITPNGFTYQVVEEFGGGGGLTFDIIVPLASAADGLDYTNLSDDGLAESGDPTYLADILAARNAATAANVAAQEERVAAEIARSGAEIARSGAEDARGAAQVAQVNSETARDAAVGSAAAAATSATDAQGYAQHAAGSVSLVAWAPDTAYAVGDVRQAPDGSTIRRNTAGTSGAAFDATEEAAWTAIGAVAGTVEQKALTASYARKSRLVDELRTPFFIAHRGSALVYPEHSMEGYRASHAAGWLIEPDLAALVDGTVVALHDATTDRTMNITGNVASKTRAEWDAAYIKPLVAGLRPCKPVYWNQILDEFGHRNCLVPEIKASDPTTTQTIIDSIVDRGLQDSVIVQSFDYSACLQAVAAGLRVMRLTGSAGPETPAQLVADGIEFVGISTTVAGSFATSCIAAGLKVIGWTHNTYESANSRLAQGAVGLFSDDPWRASRKYAALKSRETFDSGELSPNTPASVTITASSGAAGTQRIDPLVPGWVVDHTAMGTGAAFSAEMLLGQFGYGAMTGLKVRFDAQAGPSMETSDAQAANQWIWGLYVGTKTTSGPLIEATGENCYLVIQRRSGARTGYYKDTTTAPVSIGSTAVPATPYTANAAASSAEYEYEVEFTATQIIVRNLTLKDTDLVITDGTLRATDAVLSLRVKSTDSIISNIRVTR